MSNYPETLPGALSETDEAQRASYLEALAKGALFGGIALGNMVRNYNESVFVYGDQDAAQHAVWLRGDPEFVIGGEPINYEEGQEASNDPELLHATNAVLLSAFQSAQHFMKTRDSIQGIAVDGGKGFGLEKGDWEFGVRVSYEHRVRPLMNVIQSGDQQRLADFQTFLGSEFAHELTHRYYQEGSSFGISVPMETHAYAVQLLYAPRDNRVLDSNLQPMFQAAEETGGASGLSGYDKAQYLAVALFADRISKQNGSIAEMYAKGLSEQTFAQARTLLTDKDVAYLQSAVLEDFLTTSDDELTNEALRLTAQHLNV